MRNFLIVEGRNCFSAKRVEVESRRKIMVILEAKQFARGMQIDRLEATVR